LFVNGTGETNTPLDEIDEFVSSLNASYRSLNTSYRSAATAKVIGA
jgi:hypothetical protein